jgi:hypothetical protein
MSPQLLTELPRLRLSGTLQADSADVQLYQVELSDSPLLMVPPLIANAQTQASLTPKWPSSSLAMLTPVSVLPPVSQAFQVKRIWLSKAVTTGASVRHPLPAPSVTQHQQHLHSTSIHSFVSAQLPRWVTLAYRQTSSSRAIVLTARALLLRTSIQLMQRHRLPLCGIATTAGASALTWLHFPTLPPR